MVLRSITMFIATAAIAYAAISATFWVLCKIVEHNSLEALLSFTATIILPAAIGVEGVLWLKDRRVNVHWSGHPPIGADFPLH